jgi:hypothetical protein
VRVFVCDEAKEGRRKVAEGELLGEFCVAAELAAY